MFWYQILDFFISRNDFSLKIILFDTKNLISWYLKIIFWYEKYRINSKTPPPPNKTFETRAPRGTDRSPEYNEHFCYKLDSRVKILTIEWNQKQQHFITHASRSLLWIRFVDVAFRSEEVFWRSPPRWPILPHPGSAPGQIWPKHLYACAGPWALHTYQVSLFIMRFCSKCWLCVPIHIHALVHPPFSSK